MVQPVFPVITDSDSLLPLFLTSIGHWENQERTKRPGGFPDYQWLQAVSGAGELEVNGKTYSVKPGQGFFLFPDEPHEYAPVSEPWGLQWIAFNGHLAEGLTKQAGMARSGVYSLSEPDGPIAHMKAIYDLSLTGRPFLGRECSKLLYAMLLDLSRFIRTGAASAPQDAMKLQPVIRHIETRCQDDLTIDELAGTIGVSPQYLCRLFKHAFQMRPMEYVNRERINLSKKTMLLHPELKLQEVAKRSGFDSPSYFSSVFRKIEGVSPETFRKVRSNV